MRKAHIASQVTRLARHRTPGHPMMRFQRSRLYCVFSAVVMVEKSGSCSGVLGELFDALWEMPGEESVFFLPPLWAE
jgi:hypothetical protein